MKTQYAYSHNEENYHGFFDSREDAIAEAITDCECGKEVWTGEIETPIPENHVEARYVLEQVACQDDFSGEWADDWPESNMEQEKELTEALRKTFSEWLDKHDLRPRFYNIAPGTVQSHEVTPES